LSSPSKIAPISLSAAACLLEGFWYLKRPAIRGLVLAPVGINLALYSGALWVSVRYFGRFLHWLLPTWLDFLAWLLWPVFGLAFLLLVSFTFTLFANILGSPFYGLLSEKLLAAEGAIGAGSREGTAASIWQGMAIAVRRLSSYALRALPLLILFVIPGLNVIAPFLWLAFSVWFLARDYFSYPFDALGLTYAAQQKELTDSRATVVMFGGLVQLALSVPVINVFVPPAAVLGASLFVAAKIKHRQTAQPGIL